MERTELRPVFGFPAPEHVNTRAVYHFMAIAGTGVPFIVLDPCSRVDVQRQRLTEAFMQSDYTHLVMLDADHRHPAALIHHMMNDIALNPEIDVLGGLTFRRGKPFDPLAFHQQPDGSYKTFIDWPDGLIRVDLVGTGALCIAREVFEALESPYWYYDYSKVGEGYWPTEDITFCQRVRRAGFDIWVDTTISSPHLFTDEITEDTFRAYLEHHQELIEEVTL